MKIIIFISEPALLTLYCQFFHADPSVSEFPLVDIESMFRSKSESARGRNVQMN